jgi:hypothetical protein
MLWTMGSVFVFLLVWRLELPLSNDGPAHLFAAHVVHNFDDPTLAYADFWQIKPTLTYRGFFELVFWLETVVSWRDAYRLAVAITAVISALGGAVLVVAVEPRRWMLSLVAFPAAFQWAFFVGFYPFLLSTAFGCFALAVLVSAQRKAASEARRLVGFALLLTVAALCHTFAAALAGGIAVVFVAGTSPAEARIAAFLRVLVAGLPAAVIAIVTLDRTGTETAPGWLSWTERFKALAYFFQSGPPWRAGFFAMAVVAGVLAAFGKRGRREDRALATAMLLCLALALLLPWEAGSFTFVSPRALPLTGACALALFPLERLRGRARQFGLTLVGLYALASFHWAAGVLSLVDERCRYVLRPLTSSVPPGPHQFYPVFGSWCPVVAEVEREIPFFQPTLHLAQLYAVAFGGWGGNGHFGDERRFPLSARPGPLQVQGDPRVRWLAMRKAQGTPSREPLVVAELARAIPFGSVVAMLAPGESALARRMGFTIVAEEEEFFWGRFVGCEYTITGSAEAMTTVQVGNAGDGEGQRITIPAGESVGVAGLRCDDAWIRFVDGCGAMPVTVALRSEPGAAPVHVGCPLLSTTAAPSVVEQ